MKNHLIWSPRITALILLFLINGGFLLSVIFFGFNFALYLLTALISLALALWQPGGALLAIVSLTIVFAKVYTLQPVIVGQAEYKFFLLDVLMIGVYLGVIFRKFLNQQKLPWRSIDWLLILWFVLTAIYGWFSWVVWHGQENLIISSLKNYGFYPLLYFATLYLINTKTKLKELVTTAGAAITLTIGFLIYGVATGQGWGTDITPLTTEGSRLLDFDHAFYMSLAIFGALVYVLYGLKNKWRNLWVLIIPVLAFGITVSLMRHLWIASGFTILFFIWLVAKDRSLQLKRLLLAYTAVGVTALFVIFLVVGVLPNSSLSQRFNEARSSLATRASSLSGSDTSVSWRSSVWQSVWRDYQEQPVLGLGFGQKVFIDMPDYLDYVELRNVHNSFLAVFMQMGVLSFLVLLVFGWKLLVGLIKKAKGGLRPWNIAAATMLLFCAVAFLFQPYLEANFFNVIFWILTGVSRRLHEGFIS